MSGGFPRCHGGINRQVPVHHNYYRLSLKHHIQYTLVLVGLGCAVPVTALALPKYGDRLSLKLHVQYTLVGLGSSVPVTAIALPSYSGLNFPKGTNAVLNK